MGLARAQHLLERRFDLGRVRTNTQRTRQVRTGAKEQGADSGTAAIASRFFRPSTDSIMTIANRSPSGFSGHTSARRSYSAALTPQAQVAPPVP